MESKKLILTRKVKIYVNESDSELRKEFYKKLRDYSYHSRHMANDMMNALCSESFLKKLKEENEGSEIKLISDYFKSKGSKRLGQNITFQALGYKITSEKYKSLLPSFIRASLSQKVYKDFTENIKDILSGNRTFTSFKKDIPVYFMKSCIVGLKKTEDTNFIFTMFGVPVKTVLGRDKSNNQAIIDRIISGEYELADSSIQFKEKEIFWNITYKQKSISQEDKLDPEKTVGVDLGMVYPAYVSIFGTKLKMAIGDAKDFLNQRTKISTRRRLMHKNLSQTKGGHGIANKLKKLDHLSDSETNFVKTYNHFVSKKIIDFCLQNNCGFINLEKLEGIARDEKSKFILRNWSYFQLCSFIKYKAAKHGIAVREIDPKFTSQRCSKCGSIHKNNRVDRDTFVCMSCGFNENADYNASQNISIAHTVNFINQILEHEKLLKKVSKEAFDLSKLSEVKTTIEKIIKKNKNKVV